MKINKERTNVFTVSVMILLIAYCLLTVVLLAWGLITVFKDKWDFEDNMLGLPTEWTLDNIIDVFKSMSVPVTRTETMVINGVARPITRMYNINFLTMAYNSIVYTLGGTVIASIGPLLIGYCMGRFDYKFNSVLTGVIIFTMSFTLIGGGAAAIDFRKMLGVYDNLYGEVFLTFGWCSINTLMYAGLFSGVSKEYQEAARLDGANEWTVMFRIMLPFARNLFGTYFIIRLVSAWNQYDQIIYFLPSYPTISYATYLMSVSKDGNLADTPHRMATAVLMVLPMTVLFIAFKDKFLNNTSIGGVKG